MSLFNRKRPSRENQGASNTSLLPCQSGREIIEGIGKDLTQKIMEKISAPPGVQQSVYLTTLYHLAEFCQAMPRRQNDSAYSLLFSQLELALTALTYRQGLLLPQDAPIETIAYEEPQWTYAVFTLALLDGLDQVQRDRKVGLYNEKEERIGTWHPVIGKFTLSKYFSMEWQPHLLLPEITLRATVAVQLVPVTLIQWLSQNKALFNLWWEAITYAGDTVINNNVFLNIMQKAKNHTKEKLSPRVNTPLAAAVLKTTEEKIAKPITQDFVISESDALNLLFQFLTENTVTFEIPYLRVELGLFFSLDVLDNFVINQKSWKKTTDFIDSIHSYLIRSNEEQSDNYYFRYRPKSFEDRRILTGIVIGNDYLNTQFLNLPINTEFVPAIL